MTARVAAAGFLLAVLFLPASLAAQSNSPVVLSFLYPIATNGDPKVATSVHVSLLYGRVGSVAGLGLHGLATLTGGDARVVQITGIYAQTYGNASGFHFSGFASYVMREASGVQLSGGANFTRGRLRGVQAAGFLNVAGGGMSGLQFTPLFNLADAGADGFQLAGVANVSGGSFDGVQLAPGFNYVTDRMAGLQFGGVNAAMLAKGVQIGVVNIGTTTEGLQVGAVNFAEKHEGLPIGMVNLAGDYSDVDWITYGSNLSGVNTGIATSVRRFYSMLTAGLPDVQGDVSKTLILTWNYGYAIPAGRGTSIGIDLGFAHYIPEKKDDPDESDRMHFSLQARAMVERTFTRKVKGFAGGGVARISEEYRMDAPFEVEPLAFAGMALF